MARSHHLQILFLAVSFLVSACAAEPGSDETDASSTGTRFHMMPVHGGSSGKRSDPAVAGAHLTYFGGPVLTTVYPIPVFWNSAVKLQSNLTAFYKAIPFSPLYDMLAQYNIARGHLPVPPEWWEPFPDNRTTANVTDAAVRTELNRLFAAGVLELPNANNYYPVHFPSGMSITAPDGSRSCVQFCAYHGTYVRNGVNVNYGIIPDIGQAGCSGGCGGSTVTNNTDSVASHELVEATTDPAVGLATTFGPPLAWYDQVDNAEIGDLCNAQQGTTVGGDGVTYVVQKEFSNAANSCVTQ